jgi:hypothetical protein
MKVKELIGLLSEMPPEMEVLSGIDFSPDEDDISEKAMEVGDFPYEVYQVPGGIFEPPQKDFVLLLSSRGRGMDEIYHFWKRYAPVNQTSKKKAKATEKLLREITEITYAKH